MAYGSYMPKLMIQALDKAAIGHKLLVISNKSIRKPFNITQYSLLVPHHVIARRNDEAI